MTTGWFSYCAETLLARHPAHHVCACMLSRSGRRPSGRRWPTSAPSRRSASAWRSSQSSWCSRCRRTRQPCMRCRSSRPSTLPRGRQAFCCHAAWLPAAPWGLCRISWRKRRLISMRVSPVTVHESCRDELQERLTMLESKIIRSDTTPQDGAVFQSLASLFFTCGATCLWESGPAPQMTALPVNKHCMRHAQAERRAHKASLQVGHLFPSSMYLPRQSGTPGAWSTPDEWCNCTSGRGGGCHQAGPGHPGHAQAQAERSGRR